MAKVTLPQRRLKSKMNLQAIIDFLELKPLTKPQNYGEIVPKTGYISESIKLRYGRCTAPGHLGHPPGPRQHLSPWLPCSIYALSSSPKAHSPIRRPSTRLTKKILRSFPPRSQVFMWSASCGKWVCGKNNLLSLDYLNSNNHLRTIKADLHVHTVLSPSADVEIIHH